MYQFFKIVIYFYLISVYGFSTLAQTGFKKTYYLQNSLSAISRDVVEAPNGNLVMMGITHDTINNTSTNRLTIVITDGAGNQLLRKSYGNSKFNYLHNLFISRGAISDNGGIYYTCSVLDSLNNNYSILTKISYSGDTLWQKICKDSVYNLISQSVCKTTDGGLLISGFLQKSTILTRPLFLLKTDINGNRLWLKKLINPVGSTSVWFANRVVQDSVSKKLIVVGYYHDATGNAHGLTLITDSLGNNSLQFSFSGQFGGVFSDLIQTKDKQFVAVGSKNKGTLLGGSPTTICHMVKFDLGGNLTWIKEYAIPSIGNQAVTVNETADGSLVLGSTVDTTALNNLGYGIFTRVMKTDVMGNLLWYKDIRNLTNTYTGYEYLLSANLTRDGGLVLVTSFPYDNGVTPYRLIKLDSTGCDTIEAYCQRVLFTGLSSFKQTTGWELTVFPNPANEVVHIKADAPADKIFVIKISDASGRRIDEKIVEAAKEVELNTGSYAPGVYLLSLCDNGRAMETRRLVIVR